MKHITVYEEIAEHAEALIERAQWRRRDQLDELDRLEKRRAEIEISSKKAIRRSEYREAKQALNVIRQYDPDEYRKQAEELEELRKPAGAIRRNDQQ